MQMSHNNLGTTLVETMVTVVIFSLIMTGFFAVSTVGENSFQVNRAQIELQQELRKSMETMMNDLRQAGNSSVIDVPANGNWYTSITFRKPVGIVA
ncbi:MAG: prepilin-type N-terminal cleavage/methylation domain-containing protein, partial [Candidatus Omnitrophica bacterium]|nr:prepilin-type N-terminal cleavage/methylation domain-containing protein [Candidatus Omnitrophota bacterium]